MRYLTRPFAVGTLRRGSAIEQFLGGIEMAGVAAIRWVEITPTGGHYRVSLHNAEDLGGEHADLANFPPVDLAGEEYVGEGHELGRAADASDAVELAEELTAAVPGRWVNYGVAGEDYLDYVRARRTAAGRLRRGRVATAHCCAAAPSDPYVPLVAAYGSSKPWWAFQAWSGAGSLWAPVVRRWQCE